MDAKPKYPIVMVHGMGFRDYPRIGYWGRIPKALEEMGCIVYFGCQDGNGSVEHNAQHLAARIGQILEETGAQKVNIIAHSKGGLDSRYAISTLNIHEQVASLTTLSTPHNGSKTMDLVMKLPRFLLRFGCFCTDCWFRLLGDKQPQTYRALCAFTTAAAAEFNAHNPDHPNVFYQSYAFVMKSPGSDLLMWLQNRIVHAIEGENDGLLTPNAVRWSNFRGVFRGAGKRGISHCDEIDLRRRPLSKQPGEGVADIVDVYRSIVAQLIHHGL